MRANFPQLSVNGIQRYTFPSSGLGRGLGHLPPGGKASCISLFTNITRKTRPVCYKANTKKWDVPYFRHIPQILRQLFGLLPKQLHVVVVGKGNGVVARSLQRAELLAQLLRLGQHGHVVVGA